MNAIFKKTLAILETAFLRLESRVPKPCKVQVGGNWFFRYKEKSIEQAIIQKLARMISGLHSGLCLLQAGFVQELGVIQRTLDEFEEDVIFLGQSEFLKGFDA